MSFNRGFVLLLIGASAVTSAHAESTTPQKLQEEANKYAESMPTGSVPATHILGIADSTVPRVTSFKSIVAQVTQGVARDGKIKNAIGFEAIPYLLAIDTLDWDQYDQSTVTRILTRTTASFATVPSSDGKTASSAFGLQTVLYSEASDNARKAWKDDSACRGNVIRVSKGWESFVSSMGQKYPNALKIQPGASPTIDEGLLKGKDREDYQRAKKDFEAAPQFCQDYIATILQTWNASVVAAGLGLGAYSPENTVASLKSTSSVYWLTAAYGWGDGTSSSNFAGLLSVHVRKATDERTPDPANANALLSERSTLYGANLRYGSRKFGLLMEYSSRRGTTAGLPDENVRRGFVGMDARVADDLYLSWGIGSETGHRDGVGRKFALTNINYAFGSKPVFINQPETISGK